MSVDLAERFRRFRSAAERPPAQPAPQIALPAGEWADDDQVPVCEEYRLLPGLRGLQGAWPARVAGRPVGPPCGWRLLDLETTGLYGAGSRAFLAAVGTVEGDGVRVRQFLLRDLDAEGPFVVAVARALRGATALVTFNGRTFDWPLLRDRAVACRMEHELPEITHWDVLPPCRRVWGMGAPCDLGSLAERLLGEGREGEPPGELIPALYQAFLQGDAGAIDGVCRRNRHDVVALAGVAAALCVALETTQERGPEPADSRVLCGLGRQFEHMGDRDAALRCYLAATARERAAAQESEARRFSALAAARMLKSARRFPEAVALWEAECRGPVPSLRAAEELAKFHEHRARDPAAALRIARAAITRARGMSPARSRAWAHRIGRLERKTDRGPVRLAAAAEAGPTREVSRPASRSGSATGP